MSFNELSKQVQELERRIRELEQAIPAYPSQFAEPGSGGGGGVTMDAVIVREIPNPDGIVLKVEPAWPMPGDPWDGTWGGKSDASEAEYVTEDRFTLFSAPASFWEYLVWPKTVGGNPNPPQLYVTKPLLAVKIRGVWMVTQILASRIGVVTAGAPISVSCQAAGVTP